MVEISHWLNQLSISRTSSSQEVEKRPETGRSYGKGNSSDWLFSDILSFVLQKWHFVHFQMCAFKGFLLLIALCVASCIHWILTCWVWVTLFLLFFFFFNVLVVCECVISENYENTPITNTFPNTITDDQIVTSVKNVLRLWIIHRLLKRLAMSSVGPEVLLLSSVM